MTTTLVSPLAAAISRYAERFHRVVGHGHHVASPLGGWLLVALCAPAAEGQRRDALCDVLGMDVTDAAGFARRLLETPHPAVHFATGLWIEPALRSARMRDFIAALPPAVDRGDVPSQSWLDQWAREHSFGLIEHFPLDVAGMVIVGANALATKVRWNEPFMMADAEQLGTGSAWSRHLERVLYSDPSMHRKHIVATEAAGVVAVHAVDAPGLLVSSVIAEPHVSPAATLTAAYSIATALAVGERVKAQSLFTLSEGEHSLWSISEETAEVKEGDSPEQFHAVVPAWSAVANHNLTDAGLGLGEAAKALVAISDQPFGGFVARQSAMARFGQTGFEAAAVTAFGAFTGRPRFHEMTIRLAQLRFGHPYAVVAAATRMPETKYPEPRSVATPWDGLPVFSAWVAEPETAVEEEPDHFLKRMQEEQDRLE